MPREQGVVKFYNKDKNFGFIAPDGGGKEVYVNGRNLDGVTELNQGDRVEYARREGDKGPRATNVKQI